MESRLQGRLDPAEMFPAGRADISVRHVRLASGTRLRVAEAGRADRGTLLLVHGWGASIYMWREWFAIAAAEGYRALAVDLPGHGLSDKPADPTSYRLESMAGAIRELIDREGLVDVDVVAQSMGGSIMLEVATSPNSRVRHVVLVNPACFGRVRHGRLLPLAGSAWLDGILPRLVSRWLVARTHRMVFGDPSGITDHDDDELWAPSQFPSYARSMRMLLHQFDWERPEVPEMIRKLAKVRGRTMAVLGTLDRLVLDGRPYVERLVAGGAPLEIAIVEGGGHAVHEERAAEVAGRVVKFLRADQG